MGSERRSRTVGKVHEGPNEYVVWGRRQLQVGDPAPDFTYNVLNPVDHSVESGGLSDLRDRVLILHLIKGAFHTPSAKSTHELDILRRGIDIPSSALMAITVSLDLLDALASWRKEFGIAHTVASVSDTLNEVGLDYGALIKSPSRFLREATLVIAKGVIKYVDYPEDMAKKPSFYEPLILAQELAEDILMEKSAANVIAQYSPT